MIKTDIVFDDKVVIKIEELDKLNNVRQLNAMRVCYENRQYLVSSPLLKNVHIDLKYFPHVYSWYTLYWGKFSKRGNIPLCLRFAFFKNMRQSIRLAYNVFFKHNKEYMFSLCCKFQFQRKKKYSTHLILNTKKEFEFDLNMIMYKFLFKTINDFKVYIHSNYIIECRYKRHRGYKGIFHHFVKWLKFRSTNSKSHRQILQWIQSRQIRYGQHIFIKYYIQFSIRSLAVNTFDASDMYIRLHKEEV